LSSFFFAMNRLRSLFTSSQKKQLEAGLSQTKKSFFSKLGTAIIGKSKVDDDLLDELEEVLIRSDVGVATTIKIIEALEARVAKDKFLGTDALGQIMQEEITKILKHSNPSVPQAFDAPLPNSPQIVMVVGVNGVGKTTTIGKLAHHYKQAGKKVLLGAADTFRAGAIDQLQIWADRVGVSLVKQEMGSDPASVAFDTLQSAVAQQADIVFIDTAGRLHNKVNLMNELSKVKRVMDKIVPGAPHEILLVLDGSTGQNAFEQAKQFTAATDVNALAITKLDGTAKGGVVMGISDQFQIPVKYIGVGEGMEDLQLFDSMTFIETLFDDTF
jgi:fused signal recognition particle receptor